MYREALDGDGIHFRGNRAYLSLVVRFAKESWCNLPGRFDNLENPLIPIPFAYLLSLSPDSQSQLS